jgi:glutathione S-transferase
MTAIKVHSISGSPYGRADVMIAAQLDFFTAAPEWSPLTAKNPHLVRWMERMHSRPSMRATAWERVAAMAQAS